MSKLPLIEKIHLLESKLGDKWIHPILEPFKFDSSDIIKVQDAAKKIASHLGLPPFTIIITYATQKPKVSGHINLDYSNEVFIEIDNKYKQDCDIVLSILAHEICHKYLHINNLKLFPEFENEMLTDAATIFTGLGKLSLNGCEKMNISSNTSGNTTTTTTTTQKVGYMNRQQFAFVYRLICEMRRIPSNEMFSGLTLAAISEVKNVSNTDNYYFNIDYFSGDFALNKITNAIKSEITDTQKSFAKLNKNIRITQDNILSAANQLYKEYHTYTKTKLEILLSSASKSFNNEAHNYIKNVVAIEELKLLKGKLNEKETEIKIIGIALPKFITFIRKNSPKYFSKQNLEFLFQFECPSCNNPMQIKQKTLARVKCLKCNYSFIIDTGVEEIISTEQKSKEITQNKDEVWTKIKSFFQNL